MRLRPRTLFAQFSIRDLLWDTLVVAALMAWWRTKQENAALRNDNLAKSLTSETATKKEARLRQEVALLGQLNRGLSNGLAKRDAELRESLDRREEVLKALQTLKHDLPGPSN